MVCRWGFLVFITLLIGVFAIADAGAIACNAAEQNVCTTSPDSPGWPSGECRSFSCSGTSCTAYYDGPACNGECCGWYGSTNWGCATSGCVDLNNDEQNCGSVGNACEDGEACGNGNCYEPCVTQWDCAYGLGYYCATDSNEYYGTNVKYCTKSCGGLGSPVCPSGYECGGNWPSYECVACGTYEGDTCDYDDPYFGRQSYCRQGLAPSTAMTDVAYVPAGQCAGPPAASKTICCGYDQEAVGSNIYQIAIGPGIWCAYGNVGCVDVCYPVDEQTACSGKCGTVDDGCGGTYECGGCNDGLSCTTDTCTVSNTCSYATNAGTCLIGGTCYTSGATKPGDLCQLCTPTTSQTSWSSKQIACDSAPGNVCLTAPEPDQVNTSTNPGSCSPSTGNCAYPWSITATCNTPADYCEGSKFVNYTGSSCSGGGCQHPTVNTTCTTPADYCSGMTFINYTGSSCTASGCSHPSVPVACVTSADYCSGNTFINYTGASCTAAGCSDPFIPTACTAYRVCNAAAGCVCPSGTTWSDVYARCVENPAASPNACSNLVDDQGNVEYDYAGSGVTKGDAGCPVGVTGTYAPSATIGTGFTALCNATVATRSIGVEYTGPSGTQLCTFASWNGLTGSFNCPATTTPGTHTLRCYVDNTRSYQSGTNVTATFSSGCPGNHVWYNGACVNCNVDGDGFNNKTLPGCGGPATDCNDYNPAVYPGAPETCGNGVKENCDGACDPVCSVAWTNSKLVNEDGIGIEGSARYDNQPYAATSPTGQIDPVSIPIGTRTLSGKASGYDPKSSIVEITGCSATLTQNIQLRGAQCNNDCTFESYCRYDKCIGDPAAAACNITTVRHGNDIITLNSTERALVIERCSYAEHGALRELNSTHSINCCQGKIVPTGAVKNPLSIQGCSNNLISMSRTVNYKGRIMTMEIMTYKKCE